MSDENSKPWSRGILFQAESVRAILAGNKAQTRRLITSVTGLGPVREFQRSTTKGWDWIMRDRRGLWNDLRHDDLLKRCPLGSVGSRLWVRESWGFSSEVTTDAHPRFMREQDATFVVYRADGKHQARWRSAIHMPRWVSRITLEITEVRVQQLHDITEDDAKAEGIHPFEYIADDQIVPGPGFNRCRLGDQPHRLPFALKWDDINGKRAPWDSNPWVWAITFKRI